MARDKVSTDILWKDRKRILFLGLPWSFTRYSVSKDRFFISKGFFSVKDDEVRLYRIMDISLERSFMQRLVGVGTIKVCSGDKTMGDFEIKNIKRPKATKELLSDLVEKQRLTVMTIQMVIRILMTLTIMMTMHHLTDNL